MCVCVCVCVCVNAPVHHFVLRKIYQDQSLVQRQSLRPMLRHSES